MKKRRDTEPELQIIGIDYDLAARRDDGLSDQKGVSAFPVMILLALFLYLSFGPFSETAADLVEPVSEIGNRTYLTIISWIYC